MNEALGRVRSFLALYLGYARDGIRPYPARFVLIAALDALSALARGAMILALAVFVGLMEAAGELTLPLLDITLRSDFASVVLMSLALLALQFFSGWAAYFSSAQTLALGRAFTERVTARVVDRYARGPRCAADGALFRRDLVQRHVMLGARQSGVALETLVRLLRPLLYCVVALAMLLYLDWALTLLLLPGLALIAPFAYRISAGIQSDARSFYSELSQAMGARMSHFLRQLENASYASNALLPFESALTSNPQVSRFLDVFVRNRLANDRMQFMVSSINALLVGGMLLIFGYYATVGDRPWTAAIAYVGSLLYLATSVQGLFAYVSTLSRFYPQMRALVSFVDDCVKAADPGAAQPPEVGAGVVLAGVSGPPSSCAELRLERGSIACVLFAPRLERASRDALVGTLAEHAVAGRGLLESTDFVAAGDVFLEAPLDEALAACALRSPDPALDGARLGELGGAEVLAALPQGLATPMTQDVWSDLPAWFRNSVRVLPLADLPSAAVFIDHAVLAPLDDGQRAALLALMRHKLVFLVGDRLPLWLRGRAEQTPPALVIEGERLWCFARATDAAGEPERLGWGGARGGQLETGAVFDETLIDA